MKLSICLLQVGTLCKRIKTSFYKNFI